MMSEFVRVKVNATKHEQTIRASRLDDPDVADGVTVLDKPATDANGQRLDVTYNVPKGSAPAPSARPKAQTAKES
jgi:hypothetical protein